MKYRNLLAGLPLAAILLTLAAPHAEAAQPISIAVEKSGSRAIHQIQEPLSPQTNGQEHRVIPFMPSPPAQEIPIGKPFALPPANTPQQMIQPESLDQPLSLGPTPNPAIGFLALGDNNTTIPPDTMGAVGPNHLMAMLNSQVRIQDKTGAVISTVSLTAFWIIGTNLVGVPFDPKVVYDSLSGRWIATADANGGSTSSKVFFAISQTSDPTGSWDFYEFPADNGEMTFSIWSDYPGLGVNKNWIAITNNMFDVDTSNFQGAKLWAIDKTSALNGGPLTLNFFPTGYISGGTFKPAVTFDADEEKLYLVNNLTLVDGTHLIRLSEISGAGAAQDWTSSPDAGGVAPGSGFFFVANEYNSTQINAPQLGMSVPVPDPTSTELISTNDARMLNAVFRNGRIWCTHSGGLPAIGTADRTAVFWYQIDPALLDTTGDPIVQSGVLDGGVGVHHFFPSITANQNDDAYIGFTRSDATRFAEAVGTGRLGTDPLGTMDPIVVLKEGEDFYSKTFSGTRNRWGDYSATGVDPIDDTSFWTIQEYAALDVGTGVNDDRWSTWWSCIGPCGSQSNPDLIGIWRPTTLKFFLDTSANYAWDAGIDLKVKYGRTGDIPVIGDWNGDGVDDLGVWRSSTHRFLLDSDGNYLFERGVDVVANFGTSSDLPISGDWNGDGIDEIGFFRPSTHRFYLDVNGNYVWDDGIDLIVNFGLSSDIPIVGDWNGDGIDDVGVWRSSTHRFLLDTNGNYIFERGVDVLANFGRDTDLPLAGDWNGDGIDEIGVWRPDNHRFLLDTNRSYTWELGIDLLANFGTVGDLPVTGKW